MKSTKRLRSVVHSTAHHAVSGLCYVNPHLGKACKAQQLSQATIDLLTEGFFPDSIIKNKEITLSTEALRGKFYEILESEGIEIEIIESAQATFQYLNSCTWSAACAVQVKTKEGKVIEDAVSYLGDKAEIIR